jgi:hypothetical protein
MGLLEFFLNLASIIILMYAKNGKATQNFHICESDDPLFIGTYLPSSEKLDGFSIYTNSNDMSIFRNKGFWYVGNLAPWPPETHYRCVEVESCNFDIDTPPLSVNNNWKGTKRFNKEFKSIRLSDQPCNFPNDEL